MNPFVWVMALRGVCRASKEYDRSTLAEREQPIRAVENYVSNMRSNFVMRKPFKIALLILIIAVFISCVLGG